MVADACATTTQIPATQPSFTRKSLNLSQIKGTPAKTNEEAETTGKDCFDALRWELGCACSKAGESEPVKQIFESGAG